MTTMLERASLEQEVAQAEAALNIAQWKLAMQKILCYFWYPRREKIGVSQALYDILLASIDPDALGNDLRMQDGLTFRRIPVEVRP